MLTFYLVRHGLKEDIPFDPPLTKIGLKQAEVTAKFLKDVPFKEIVASPKLRTRQTAKAIAEAQSLQVTIDERLRERLEWERKESFGEFLVEWGKTDLDRNYQPKTGDSSVNKGNKMTAVIDELANKYGDGNILIVTHGGSIGDLLRHVLGKEAVPHRVDPLTGAPHIYISECSVTMIEKSKDKYILVKKNDISHLSTPLT